VWARFANDRAALADAVERITAAADEGTTLAPVEDEEGHVEGRIVFRKHREYERDPAAAREKKARTLRRTGKLDCEVCGFDFANRYGELGEGFIECHHTLPLGAGRVRTTNAADLALLCSNCHRMIHLAEPMATVDELRAKLRRT
jgi:5-methylcytosine-specific restriction enzyme A